MALCPCLLPGALPSSSSLSSSLLPGGFPSWLSCPPEKNLLCSAFSCPFPPASQRCQQPASPARPACPLPAGALTSPLWVPRSAERWARAAGRCAGARRSPACTPHREVCGLPDRRGPDVPPDAGRPRPRHEPSLCPSNHTRLVSHQQAQQDRVLPRPDLDPGPHLTDAHTPAPACRLSSCPPVGSLLPVPPPSLYLSQLHLRKRAQKRPSLPSLQPARPQALTRTPGRGWLTFPPLLARGRSFCRLFLLTLVLPVGEENLL